MRSLPVTTISLLSTVHAAKVSVTAENGIGRVINMLTNMKAKSEKEKQDEAVKFKGFETWCTSTKSELAANIEKLGEEISEGKNIIKAQTGKAKTMQDKSEKNGAEITKLTKEKEAKLASRAEDKKVFMTVKADYETSITAIENAVKALKSQPKTVSQGGAGALVQIQESSMSKAQKELISMLVTGAPSAHAYENHSGGVISMLEDLKAKFIEELNAEQVSETKKEGATNQIVMSLMGQIENLEEEKKRFDGAAAKHTTAASDAQAELEGDSATLAADTKSQDQVTSNCALKLDEFAQRSALRDGELEALSQAIEVMEGIANKRTGAGAESFIQVSSETKQIVNNADKLNKVMKYLTNEGQKMNSKKLQLLALKMTEGGGAFDKVLKMIQGLIDRLKAETLEETGKLGQCNVWMSENKSDIETSEEAIAALKATIDEQTGVVGQTSQKIKDLSMEEKDAAKALADATKVRAEESATNKASIADAKEGEEAVDQALQILSDFYNKAATATALIQESDSSSQAPIDASDTPGTWDSSYKGNQSGGSDVINIMEVIQADFLRLRSETESAEAAAVAAYDEFVKESEMSKAARDSSLTHAKEGNSHAKAAKAAAEKDLDAQNKILSGLIEQKRVIEQDKGCLVSSSKTPDELFKERMDARANEIESLKNALEMLK